MISILHGDCREVLRTLPDESVHCVVTSPPYWGLRDYGTAKWEGGDADCDHSARRLSDFEGVATDARSRDRIIARDCKCGAIRIDSQIGLEPDLHSYVATMVAVFREVRRVLRKDGTLWLNLGDSYASGGRGCGADGSKQQTNVGSLLGAKSPPEGLKPKDLCGIPWRVAFALQEDGWYLRQDIIWSKPNPMPESIRDRCTKAHEYLFLLSKCERYYYDADAIAEDVKPWNEGKIIGYDGTQKNCETIGDPRFATRITSNRTVGATRNKRSVWEVTTQPFSEAHFATFPPALIEPCIKAGTSEKGCCGKCGAPWRRQVEQELVPTSKAVKTFVVDERDVGADSNDQGSNRQKDGHRPGWINRTETLSWSPSCRCDADTVPCTVLDPFAGAGTTGLVADRLQRNAILIELNPAYAAMSESRIVGDAPLFAQVNTAADYNPTDDFARSIDEAYRAIRERKANGGPGWTPP